LIGIHGTVKIVTPNAAKRFASYTNTIKRVAIFHNNLTQST